MLNGSKVILQAIEQEELHQLMEWRNLPYFRKYFREYREINFPMQELWYETKVLNDPSTIMFSIKKSSNNELLGCCGLCYINWIHRHADLSLYIGWEQSYIDVEGFAKDACVILFNYGFGELNLNKIWTEIYDFDEKKIELYRELGFNLDGRLRENYFYNNKWRDSLIFSLLCREWIRSS